MTLPLAGFRILDLSDEATVLASRLLADLGADVVRVEPINGDPVRWRPPFVADVPSVEGSLAHLLYNAGKRSLALDLDEPDTWRLVEQLVPHCDVVIGPLDGSEPVRKFLAPGVIERLSPSAGIVECVFRRPFPDAVATDLIGTAAGGLLCLNGYPGDPPNKPAGQLAYKQASLATALSSVSMLLEQSVSGSGGRAVVSMQEAVMWTTIQSANENYWYWLEERPARRGISNLGGQTIFQAGDGRWVSFYQHPPAWPAFVRWVKEALGDDHFDDPEWDDQFYRFQNAAEVTSVTAALCETLGRDELVAEAQRRAILCVPVQSVADIAVDPHLRDRHFFAEVWSEPLARSLETYRAPFVSSAYEASAAPAPGLGQHSREILRDVIGIPEQQVQELTERGVVGVMAEAAK